jgi:hypothetical protein
VPNIFGDMAESSGYEVEALTGKLYGIADLAGNEESRWIATLPQIPADVAEADELERWVASLPQIEQEASERDEFERWLRTVPEVPEQEIRTPEDRFIYLEEWLLTPESSNVFGMRYFREDKALHVGYVGYLNQRNASKLRFYAYLDVSEAEARVLFKRESSIGTPSAGGIVWDKLRVRGPGNFCSTLKDFLYLGASGDYERKYPC